VTHLNVVKARAGSEPLGSALYGSTAETMQEVYTLRDFRDRTIMTTRKHTHLKPVATSAIAAVRRAVCTAAPLALSGRRNGGKASRHACLKGVVEE
jgi:hypothetical protein